MNELLNANSFGELLEITRKNKNCSYIEAVLIICETRGLDVETVPELLTPKLKKRIHLEAKGLNMLRVRAK